jgi:hypothetical protein
MRELIGAKGTIGLQGCSAEEGPIKRLLTFNMVQHAATPLHNTYRHNFTDCFNISVTLASLKYKVPDDGRGPKHVGAILI